MTTDSQLDLRKRLRGVRALLLDLDGVLVLAGRPLPGAADALAELERRAIPYRIVTNTSLLSRVTLARRLASLGLDVPAGRVASALSASAAYTRRHHPDGPLFLIASEDARTEFGGQRILGPDEADAPDARAAAVVVGDSPEEATYPNLNRAFRLLRGGAELLAMHKNRWWITPDGRPSIDSGSLVAGLEFATGLRARILGKPSPVFFREMADEVAEELAVRDGGRRLARAEIAMVGDDVWNDVLGAQRAGLRGAFVLSGKHGPDDLARAATGPRGRRPDAVAASLGEIVAALD